MAKSAGIDVTLMVDTRCAPVLTTTVPVPGLALTVQRTLNVAGFAQDTVIDVGLDEQLITTPVHEMTRGALYDVGHVAVIVNRVVTLCPV